MAIRRDIAGLFEAIPDRIEVSGQAPTWRVTGGSFDAVVEYANEAFDEPVVLSRHDRTRWWRRVTLTVTTDPELAAAAPPLAELVDPPAADAPAKVPAEPDPAPQHRADPPEELFGSFLDAAFERQEAERALRVHEQRRRVL